MSDPERRPADELRRLRARLAELEAGAAGAAPTPPPEEERSFRALFETMAQGVVYQAPDGRIIAANPAAERILGVSLDQMQGRTSRDPRWRAVREDGSDFPGDRHPAMEALRTGKPVDGVTMGVFHPGLGEYRWILVSAVPQFLPGEAKPYQVFATFTDITERRKAEAALQAAKEYAENLIETANALVVGLDLAGGITVFNRAAEAVTGYSRAELLHRNWFEVLVPRERYPQVWEKFERLAAGGLPKNLENPILTKAGEERHVAWQNSEVFEQGRLAGTISFGLDITDRKRAEEDLRRRTRALSTLLEVSRGLAGTLDLDTVLQATTDSAARLLGLGTAAVYLLEGEVLRLGATTPPLPPQFPARFRESSLAEHPHIRAALDSAQPVLVPDVAEADLTAAERAVAERRNLRTVLFLPLLAGVSNVGTLIVGSVGRPQAVSEAEIDLCRTLANLAALAIANSRLYRSGRQHAAALEEALSERERAERERLGLERRLLHAQKLEGLGVLAGGIAHDFNNLLMAVLGNLDLALRKLPAASAAREDIEQSVQAARRATDLTRQMLAYSGKGRFVVEPLDLGRLVEENAHLLRAAVAHTSTLDLRIGRPLPAIEADAGQVQQVIMNLITNAAEAIGDGPGVITVGVEERQCDATCLGNSRIEDVPPAGRFVCLEVADTGCGMDEPTQQRLFDPFFSTKATGRGLGMSAILGIVRGHRGAIFVESAAGRGTTIRVLFPAAPEAARAAEPAGTAGPADRGAAAPSGTVLVVDDEELVRRACSAMVRSLGVPVLTAADGREAVEVFRQAADRISHVVLDLTMPHMDGIATFKELVRIRPGVKVILCSGYDEQESVRQLSSQGLASFLQKPYSLARLREALGRLEGGSGGAEP